MPTYRLKNTRTALTAAQVYAADLATACELAAEQVGCGLRELLDRIPTDFEIALVSDANFRIPVPPRRCLFGDRVKETVH